MSISSEIERLNKELPSTVKLVAVSKFNPSEAIMEAYQAGQRVFGESRPQELLQKVQELPRDIQWHFIGHLQTNKLKMVLPYAALIHSVDSERLLMEINKYAVKNNLKVKCLLELFVAQEETKQGFSKEELMELMEKLQQEPLEGVEICGLTLYGYEWRLQDCCGDGQYNGPYWNNNFWRPQLQQVISLFQYHIQIRRWQDR